MKKSINDWVWLGRLPHFLKASQELRQQELSELRDLVERSKRLLVPFEEPLVLNLAMNRWLAGESEEAYSDWLAWFFREIPAADVLRILSLGEQAERFVGENVKAKVERKVALRVHGRKTRRLDIVIRIQDGCLLVLEIKKGSADWAQTFKQNEYVAGVKNHPDLGKYPDTFTHFLLLATDSGERIVDQFSFVSFRDLCREIRLFVMRSRRAL